MRILYADDEPHGRIVISTFLESNLGHQVTQCDTGQQALELFKKSPFPFVMSDIRMPVIDGIELLKKLKALPEGKTADIVLITAFGDMETAVAALREGAYDYLNKPVDLEELAAVVNRIAEHQSLIKENYELTYRFEEKVAEATRETKSQLETLQNAYAEIIGIGRIGIFSESMYNVISMARKLQEDRILPVLIEGETGTGKEIVARLIHSGDKVATTPFIPINCSAISPNLFESELFGYEGGAFTGAKQQGQIGKFELAKGGTIFFDEIGDMPLEMQPKLLRVLQEKEFYRVGGLKKIKLDARVICASNRDLESLVESGQFRRDLFYRFNIGRIYIPPLSQRKEDIEPLARMFLEQFSSQRKRKFRTISKEAVEIMENYSWPGNVRELQNTIERVVLIHDEPELTPHHLRFLTSSGSAGHEPRSLRADSGSVVISLPPKGFELEKAEIKIINEVLSMFNGNKTRTASYLGITRSTLRSKINKAK